VEEAAALLAEHAGEAKILAGGQSLVPMLNFRLAAPSMLVDINDIEGLDRIELRKTALSLARSSVGMRLRRARSFVPRTLC
jgi:carbon-monoxide dehydrogenase medium subunit